MERFERRDNRVDNRNDNRIENRNDNNEEQTRSFQNRPRRIRTAVMNSSLLQSLIKNRISNFAVDRPYRSWLRSRKPLRVRLKDGSYRTFAALNTDISTSSLPSFDLGPLIQSISTSTLETAYPMGYPTPTYPSTSYPIYPIYEGIVVSPVGEKTDNGIGTGTGGGIERNVFSAEPIRSNIDNNALSLFTSSPFQVDSRNASSEPIRNIIDNVNNDNNPLSLFTSSPVAFQNSSTSSPLSVGEDVLTSLAFDYSSTYFSKSSEILTPVNQYLCGSCWAVSTVTAVSDSFVVSGVTSTNPNLSITYALSCYPSCPSTDTDCQTKTPDASLECLGGNYATLAVWATTNTIVSNTCVDYRWCSDSQICNSTTPPDSEESLNDLIPSCGCNVAGTYSGYSIQNVKTVVLTSTQASDPTAIAAIQVKIKEHIVNVGPVLVGLIVFSNFMAGDFTSDSNPHNIYLEYVGNATEPQTTLPDFLGCHALCIVGWGTFPVKATLLPSDSQKLVTVDDNGFCMVPCWKIRNSWGPTWCDNGHVYIAMYPYNTTCCAEIEASITDNNGNTVSTGGMVIFEPSSSIQTVSLDQNNNPLSSLPEITSSVPPVSPDSTTSSYPPVSPDTIASTIPPSYPPFLPDTSSTSPFPFFSFPPLNLPPSSSPPQSKNWGLIIGITVGIVVLLTITGIIVFVVFQRRSKKKQQSSLAPSPIPPINSSKTNTSSSSSSLALPTMSKTTPPPTSKPVLSPSPSNPSNSKPGVNPPPPISKPLLSPPSSNPSKPGVTTVSRVRL